MALALVVVTSASRARAAEPDACFPACRAGYLCHEGRCISACNPPCEAGQVCTATGECAAATPSSSPPRPPPMVDVPGAPATPPPPEPDPGWARGAFYFGVVSATLDLALTTAVIANNPQHARRSRSIGGLAIVLFGVNTPLVALGAGSARGTPGVVGHPRLRVAGWLSYGLAIVGSAYLLAQSRFVIIDNRQVLGVGLLGTFSTLALALDARCSAREAEALGATSRSAGASAPAGPSLGLALAPGGALASTPLLGWAGSF